MIGRPVALLCLLLGVCCAASPAFAFSLNDFRAASNRTPLRVDGKLTGLAQGHAADMARRDHLDHDGFMSRRGPAGARAENVSYGCDNQDCAIRQWSRSAPHRANMLLSDVRSYGIASAMSSSGRRYWVLELGAAPDKARKKGPALLRSGAPGAQAKAGCVVGFGGCLRSRP